MRSLLTVLETYVNIDGSVQFQTACFTQNLFGEILLESK
jgi:hypothetical protein